MKCNQQFLGVITTNENRLLAEVSGKSINDSQSNNSITVIHWPLDT